MKFIKLAAVIVIAGILSACAGTAKRNANLYAEARAADVEQTKVESLAESNAAARRADGFAALAAKCADSACVANLSRDMVLSDAIAALRAAAMPAQSQAPVPYERDSAQKFRDLLSGITPLAQIGANAYLGAKQSDNARDIALGDQAAGVSIVQAVAELGSQPTTVAGGDIIGGDRIADSFNDNSTRGDEIAVSGDGSAVGDGNETVNGDNANNSGRINSDDDNSDNSDNSDDGDDCTGSDCSVTQPVEPPDDTGL